MPTFQQGCAFKFKKIREVCIQNVRSGVHSNYREGYAFYDFINAHPYPCNTHPLRYPWNSGPIQWSRGGLALKPSAAARPDRPCHPSFDWIKFWHVWNPLPEIIRLRLSVLVRYWAGHGE